MSASSCSLDEPDKLLLRWSEDAFSPSREELVQMLETSMFEAVICSSLKVVEKTEVFLIGKYSTESGVVRSCRPAGGKYIVTILIHSQKPNPPDIDPGMLAIDSWMSEEQEQAILDEIEKEIGNQQFRKLSAAARARFNSTCCEGTAALNRLLRFTVKSSTARVPASLVQFWSRFRHAAGTCSLSGTLSGTAPIPPGNAVPRPEGPTQVSAPIQ